MILSERVAAIYKRVMPQRQRRVGRVCPQAGITGTKPREAYGVRGACSRFRTAPHIRQREQAPRTPYASRDTTALVIRLCNLLRIPRKSAQKNKIFAYIIQRAALRYSGSSGALRTDAPYPPLALRQYVH